MESGGGGESFLPGLELPLQPLIVPGPIGFSFQSAEFFGEEYLGFGVESSQEFPPHFFPRGGSTPLAHFVGGSQSGLGVFPPGGPGHESAHLGFE